MLSLIPHQKIRDTADACKKCLFYGNISTNHLINIESSNFVLTVILDLQLTI